MLPCFSSLRLRLIARELFGTLRLSVAESLGVVRRLSALTDAMENEVRSLTKDRQHLGMHVNFSGDLFTASHY
ncbi:MAG TPA: hypothetical protein VGL12_10075 [Roseiarcus sp.]